MPVSSIHHWINNADPDNQQVSLMNQTLVKAAVLSIQVSSTICHQSNWFIRLDLDGPRIPAFQLQSSVRRSKHQHAFCFPVLH